jgi:hypothetical protein
MRQDVHLVVFAMHGTMLTKPMGWTGRQDMILYLAVLAEHLAEVHAERLKDNAEVVAVVEVVEHPHAVVSIPRVLAPQLL